MPEVTGNEKALKIVGTKILEVMGKISSVKKDGKNEAQRYKYASDKSVVESLRQHMMDVGLVAIPSHGQATVIEKRQTDPKTNVEKVSYLTTVPITYRLIDIETGLSVEMTVTGQGWDPMEKGIYKAMTGAGKYFFLKTFMLPTEDDPENGGPPAAAKPPAPAAPASGSPPIKKSPANAPKKPPAKASPAAKPAPQEGELAHTGIGHAVEAVEKVFADAVQRTTEEYARDLLYTVSTYGDTQGFKDLDDLRARAAAGQVSEKYAWKTKFEMERALESI